VLRLQALRAKIDRKSAISLQCAQYDAAGGLGATYDDQSRLTGKRVVDFFLLVLTKLFRYVLRLRG